MRFRYPVHIYFEVSVYSGDPHLVQEPMTQLSQEHSGINVLRLRIPWLCPPNESLE